jgi:hypothetical protein
MELFCENPVCVIFLALFLPTGDLTNLDGLMRHGSKFTSRVVGLDFPTRPRDGGGGVGLGVPAGTNCPPPILS